MTLRRHRAGRQRCQRIPHDLPPDLSWHVMRSIGLDLGPERLRPAFHPIW